MAMVNEKRLIDANALLEQIEEQSYLVRSMGRVNGKGMFNHTISKTIEDAPTVDAVEVVHGRWEQCFEDWRQQIEGDKCSACGFEHYGCGIKHYHYCPNCGAKMDGGNDNGC